MYRKVYFKDDHNRILQVAMHKKTGAIKVHIFDKEGYSVPFPNLRRPKNLPKFEFDRYNEMVQETKNCALFKKD